MATVYSIRKGRARRAPSIENRKVTSPGTRRHRKTNKELRPREYLTPAEVDRLMVAAGKVGRHGHRDATLSLLAYRHALRVSELVSLRWDAVDLKAGSSASPDSRTVCRRYTRCAVLSYAPSGGCGVTSRTLTAARTSSPVSAVG